MKNWFFLAVAAGLACWVPATASDCLPTDGCCSPPIQKQCIARPDVKKTTKTVYAVKEVDYCLKNYCILDLFRHGCGSCCDTCQPCGKPRVKRVLIKKERTCEEPTCKCEVEHVLCPTYASAPCGTVIVEGQPALVRPQPEQAPMPSPKK
jgi:hypothetical protein